MRVVDDGDLRKYRIELPNTLDDSELSPFAFRLYAHLKRRAGDSGTCFEGVRPMAEVCKMSPSSVVNAKRELLDKGFITITPGDKTTSTPDTIRIVNIWLDNFQKYTPTPVHLINTPVHQVHTPVHEEPLPCAPNKHPVHEAVHKKEPVKKELREERTTTTTTREAASDIPDVMIHPAVTLYHERMRPDKSLSVHQCTLIAAEVSDLKVWDDVLIVFSGNEHRGRDGTGRYVGNAIDRYRQEVKKAKEQANAKSVNAGNGNRNGRVGIVEQARRTAEYFGLDRTKSGAG